VTREDGGGEAKVVSMESETFVGRGPVGEETHWKWKVEVAHAEAEAEKGFAVVFYVGGLDWGCRERRVGGVSDTIYHVGILSIGGLFRYLECFVQDRKDHRRGLKRGVALASLTLKQQSEGRGRMLNWGWWTRLSDYTDTLLLTN